MKLQTDIRIPKQEVNQIDYNSELLLFGSCFSEHIFKKLDYFKFKALSNPLGIQFNIISTERFITRALASDYYTYSDLLNRNGFFFSFDAHSKFFSSSAIDFCGTLNEQLDRTKHWLSTATHIFITLGTSWVYRHIESNTVVANCHKLPQQEFTKELLSADVILKALKKIVSEVIKVNEKATFVFTVSPIRHLKDGMVENNRSKALLLTAIHNMVEKNDSCFYFPSYEIQMDELRDYRFYKADMLHPSQQAVDIIWERLRDVWFSDQALQLSAEIEQIQLKIAHKPFYPQSEAHQKFLDKLQLDIEAIKRKIPHVEFI